MEYIGSLKPDSSRKANGAENGAGDASASQNVPPASLLDNYPDTTINPYELMGIERNATEADIKRAYKKGALKWHPDKHPPEQKSKAQKAFQRLTTAYAVLVDPVRRKHYDATGRIHDALHMDPDDPWRWQPFYQHCWAKMADGDIEAFAKEYRFSDEEREDLLKQYTLRQGNMTKVYEHVILSNPMGDDERYRKWINDAIKAGEVESYSAYSKETAKSIKSRKDKAKKEAKEAEEMKAALKDKGQWFEPPSNHESKDLLALAIQAKNKSRSVALLDHLMDKYVTKPGAKGGKKGSTSLPSEPSEEAFEKNRKKAFQEALERDKQREDRKMSENRRKRKARQVQDDEEEEEEDDDGDPVKQWDQKRRKVKQQMEDDAEVRREDPSEDENARKAKREDEIWGQPAKRKSQSKSKSNATAKKPVKKPPAKKAPAKKPAAKPAKPAKPSTKKATARRSKRAIVESEDEEDDPIELGSDDSAEDDDEFEG